MTDLEKAQQVLDQAQAALVRAEAARAAEERRIGTARRDLAALDAQVLAADPTDTRALMKLDAERVGLRVALEVLGRARLPRAQAVLAEAQAAVRAAREARDRVRDEEHRRAFEAEAAALNETARTVVAKLEELTAAHADAGHRWGYRDRWTEIGESLRSNALARGLSAVGEIVEAVGRTDAEAAERRRRDDERRAREAAPHRATQERHFQKLMAIKAAEEAEAARWREAANGPRRPPWREE